VSHFQLTRDHTLMYNGAITGTTAVTGEMSTPGRSVYTA
jgi:hypothetical protein